MTYEESHQYLEAFINYESRSHFNYRSAFKLERVSKFLHGIGDPQKRLRVIHVAGTKGKGSTSCFIAHILREAGFRVGLYTSPHLTDLRERIRIFDSKCDSSDGSCFSGMILKNEFAHLLALLRPRIDHFTHSFQNFGSLTFFEILTAMAFLYFVEKKTDFVVLETGLGGRLDATNTASALISVITPVSFDHEHILGSTLTEIAYEKAGIIKPENVQSSHGHLVCVSAKHPKEAMDVIRRKARQSKTALFIREKDFKTKKLNVSLLAQDFCYRGLSGNSFFCKTGMLGDHQITNASLALAACEALSFFGFSIAEKAMVKGVGSAFWPARLEVIQTKPFIILDGAHNRDSAQRLAHFVQKTLKGYRRWLVFGASSDKDIRAFAEQLAPLADRLILTRADNPRAADPELLHRQYFKKNKPLVTKCVEEAMDILSRELRGDDAAIVTGSLFVVGEARALWRR